MAFTKLDDGLVFSSLMREDDATFRVFIILLSRTGPDGIAPVSSDFLQTITKKGEQEIEQCLKRLESPDPSSRSTEDDGRRIRRVDGGFFMINYKKYRSVSPQDYERERKAKQRQKASKKQDVRDMSGTCPGHSASLISFSSGSDQPNDPEKTDRSTKPDKPEPSWRTDIEIFLAEEESAFQSLIADQAWMDLMAKYNPGIDVMLSLEKARMYWRDPDQGWRKKKSKRGATKINWRLTYQNALSQSFNRVYPSREQRNGDLQITYLDRKDGQDG